MALMSVKRYLTPLEEATAYRKLVSMLLDGVAANALNLDPEAFRLFCDRIGELRQEMASDTTVESLMSHAGKVVQEVGDYSRDERPAAYPARRDAVHDLDARPRVGGCGRAWRPGRGTEDDWRRLRDAGRLDPQGASAGVSRNVRDEAGKAKAEPDRPAQALNPEVVRKQEPARGSDLDPITELQRQAAENASVQILDSGSGKRSGVLHSHVEEVSREVARLEFDTRRVRSNAFSAI